MNPSQLVNKLLRTDLSFAVWREPGLNKVTFVASRQPKRPKIGEVEMLFPSKGFLFAPFDVSVCPLVWIPAEIEDFVDIPEEVSSSICIAPLAKVPFVTSKDQYLEQAVSVIDQIKRGRFQKAILSRIAQHAIQPEKLGDVFSKLCNDYPSAYVFCVYTPFTGLWMGATPELFLSYHQGKGSTVALAGTRRPSADGVLSEAWRDKEIDEQAVVAQFISGVLKNYGISKLNVEGPREIRAGQVMHLKTTFDFDAELNAAQLTHLAMDLHPTPAVSGFPKQKAMEAIACTETHDRSYYGGFLGVVDRGNCDFYVSLRCMTVDNQHAYLYVGGGLTHDSIPEQEWDETVLKSQTLLSVLKNI